MSNSVYGIPLENLEGETKTLATSAGFVAVKPNYHEVKMYCASQWRLALSPALLHCIYNTGTTYTEYVQSVTDRDSTTHLPLDAMPATDYVYLGFTEPVKGIYLDIGSNANAEAATLDIEYLYDVSAVGYKKLTGTVSGALTVGETVTGSVSGATATLVYSGATYIVVKNITGEFALAENAAGSAEACNTLTAIGAVTSDPDGAYTWNVPTNWKQAYLGTFADKLFSKCFWLRFKPSAALSAAVDINEIIPIYKNTSYGYMEPGMEYQFSFSNTKTGGFVVAATTGTPTLDITWIQH